ncbi:MAG: alkaline phosphatase family protein [Planctomycetales bacterium]|nr:alkaline phosphatase family protein [Planctomycetales bacterium]
MKSRPLQVVLVLAALLLAVSTGRCDQRVLVIGIDGAGGSYVESTLTPHIDALAAAGGASYEFLNEGALIANPPGGYGASGVNWSTIATGASAAHHGVVDNSFSGSDFDQFPHFFKYLKDANASLFTASIVDWAPINDRILADQYADLEIGGVSDPAVRDAAVSLLQTGDPDAIFLHFDQVDGAGHASGWGSLPYRQALQNVDGLIGDVVAALNARPGVVAGEEDWLVLVTADHGGIGNSHNAGQGPINWEVPFVVSGPSVADGVVLQPGTLRDVATTALWHMGVDPFSTAVDGRVVGLPFGSPNGIVGDVNQDGVVSGDGTGPAASDDVSAFAAGWMSTGHTSLLEAYGSGDLNLDRVTDLADWIILNRLDPAMGAAAWQAVARGVPEPPAGVLLSCCALGLALVRRWEIRLRRARTRRPGWRVGVVCAASLVVLIVSGNARRTEAALTTDLVALYDFEGDLFDSAGAPEANHGAGVNGPQFAPGKIGQALWLPGVHDSMSIAAPENSELDFGSTVTGDAVDFSISMWIRQDDFASDPAVLSNKDWNSGDNTGVNWAVKGNGVFDLNTKGDVGARRDLDTAANSAPLSVGNWNLVVMTVDRDGPTQLFINGIKTGAITTSSPGTFRSGLPWSIGQDGTGAYGVEFTGAVDELAFWRRALEPTEVATLWNSGAGMSLGTEVFDAQLRLVVDRDTGAMRIENNTADAQDLLGYQITSVDGALNRANWQPVAGRLDAVGDKTIDADDRWLVLEGVDASGDLSEVSLGEGTLPQGAMIELGVGAWRKYYADDADLRFVYATPNSDVPVEGVVEFVGNGGQSYAELDLNHDGAIDDGDYAAFLAGYGADLAGASMAMKHSLGDLTGDGRHDVADFLAFKSAFDTARGAGAFTAMVAGGEVPEPSAFALAAFVCGLLRRPGNPRSFG